MAEGITVAGIRRAAGVRARRHHQDEVSGLLPDRRRLHPVGQGSTTFRSGRGAARAPARSSPMRSPSPTSIRCATICCSSASSTPIACRCRTSTSTSARTGAAKSSTTCRPSTARRRSPRSSPSERCRPSAVVRDVGRVLQMPYGQVDRIAKLIPANPANPVTLAAGARHGAAAQGDARQRRAGRRADRDRARSSRGSTATPRRTPPASSSATGR